MSVNGACDIHNVSLMEDMSTVCRASRALCSKQIKQLTLYMMSATRTHAHALAHYHSSTGVGTATHNWASCCPANCKQAHRGQRKQIRTRDHVAKYKCQSPMQSLHELHCLQLHGEQFLPYRAHRNMA